MSDSEELTLSERVQRGDFHAGKYSHVDILADEIAALESSIDVLNGLLATQAIRSACHCGVTARLHREVADLTAKLEAAK